MPKQKTHRGAAKRFKVTASGRIKHRSAFRSHGFTNKTTKSKRHLRGSSMALLNKNDELSIKRLLCIQ